MSLTLLTRLSGLAAALGGSLWSLRALSDPVGGVAGPGGLADKMSFIVPLLLAAGLAGLYALYGSPMAGVAQAGFIQSFAGLALLAGGFAAQFPLGVEGAARISSFGFLILALGLVLLGLETLKTGTLPRWNFLPLALGVLIPLSTILGGVTLLRVAMSLIFGLGWVLLGYLLWQPQTQEAGEQHR